MLLNIHFCLVCFLISLSLLLIFSRNPVYSVFFLIAIFFISSSILVVFTVDFIGLLFVLIYVGAVAVLFLFVVMMLEIKTNNTFLDVLIIRNLVVLFSCILSLDLIYNSKLILIVNRNHLNSFSLDNIIDSFNSIDVFGLYLYNFYVPLFLIAGIVLLVAMLGAISLTLKYRILRKNQLVSKQLARTSNFLSFFS